MKLRFFLLLALCLTTSSVLAQTATSPLTALGAKLLKHERLEGTITATSGGVTSTASMQWEAPQKLRLVIEPNDAALIDAQIVVAEGEQTFNVDPHIGRVQRLPYNTAQQWWRSWGLRNGGPANAVLFGHSETQLGTLYTVKELPSGLSPMYQLDANKAAGQVLVRDLVRFGGGGDKAFHAAFKYPVLDRPARITLTLSADGTQMVGRREFDESGRLLSSAEITFDEATKFPRSATVKDDRGQLLSSFTYNLKARTEPFPDDTFKLDTANTIIEDAELKALSEYSGADANAKFNRGVVLAGHVEDFGAAFTAWDEAARLQPKSAAPHFATYDAALTVRDLARATTALDKLSQLLGADNYEVLSRRANIAGLRRDWSTLAGSLDAARKAQPQDLGTLLLRADVHRAVGEFDAAQALLLEVLASPHPQPLNQIKAAEILATMVTPQLASELRKRLPADTQWQRLARAHLALVAGQEVGDPNLTSDAARASLAIVQESFGQDAAALPVWQDLLKTAPELVQNIARGRMVGLAARRGDVNTSLTMYRELMNGTKSEKTQRGLQDALIESWRKAFRQDELRAALQQRATIAGATDDDARLWLAFQETNGSFEDVGAAIQLGLVRFPRSAWWYSRQAEYEMNDAGAQSGDMQGQLARDRLVGAALRNVQRAIELDPNQPYYQMQRTLILTARANPPTNIASGQRFRDRATALSEVNKLLDANKGDVDVAISAALQRLALDDPGKHDPSIQLLTDALQGGLPGPEAAGEGRHITAFAARQSLAMTLRRQKQPGLAARQYEMALDASASAADELGVAINYLKLLAAESDINGIARLLERLAREPWPFGAHQDLMGSFINVLAANRIRASEVATALKKQTSPYSRLATAQLYQALSRPVPAAPQSTPGTPPAPTFTPETALRELNALLPELPPLTDSTDKILAARTAALLGEIALGASQPTIALQWFQKAVAAEPREPSLRLALAFAHVSDNNIEAAKRVRDDLVRTLSPTTDNLLRLAALSKSLSLKDEAARLTWQAFGIAQVTPEVSPAQMELAAFSAARAAFNAGQKQRGTQIYWALALPQWSLENRAAALLDLEQQLRTGGDAAGADAALAAREALGLSATQLRRAELFLQSLG